MRFIKKKAAENVVGGEILVGGGAFVDDAFDSRVVFFSPVCALAIFMAGFLALCFAFDRFVLCCLS